MRYAYRAVYLNDFNNAKTILRYLTIERIRYVIASSLGPTAKFPFCIIQHKGYNIKTAAVSTI